MMNKRRTKIVATIGPATESPENLEKLILAGINIVRLNMSHANPKAAQQTTEVIRDLAIKHNRRVGVLMDLQGPAIRTGELPVSLDLKPGEKIGLTVRGETSEEIKSVDVNYDHLVEDIQIGNIVIVDNGLIHLKVLEKKQNQLVCEVLTKGTLSSRKHINLPGVHVQLPSLTEKDLIDVQAGIEMGVDFFALSFCREAKDVRELRGIIEAAGSHQRIVSKLEDQVGLSNLDEIIAESDAIMVARGDLGIEIPFEELPIIQRRIVKHCRRAGKPVIVATHMLESMIDAPSPTRAEVTDVSNAVYEEADCIMLSGETSVGMYPEQCVQTLDTIARRTERSGSVGFVQDIQVIDHREILMRAGRDIADELGAKAIIIFTQTGTMARNAAWLRSETPVYAFTDVPELLNQLTIYWGLEPYMISLSAETPELNIEAAENALIQEGIINENDWIVIVTHLHVHGEYVETVQMRQVTID
jgi:pyruvate kinase